MAFSGPLSLGGAQTVYPGEGGTGTRRVEYAPMPMPTGRAYGSPGLFEGASFPGSSESITGALSGPLTPSIGGSDSLPGMPSGPSGPVGPSGHGGLISEIGGLISEVSGNTPAAELGA